jgi:quaternary ammonium compound-resistance protein SugE
MAGACHREVQKCKKPGPDATAAKSHYDRRMAWTLLLLAAALEVGWAVGLKYSAGFTRLWPSVWTALAMIASMGLLAAAARTLPIGTAYAVWTGIGAAGTAVLGVYLFQEPASGARMAGVLLIVAGVVLLKTAS